MTEGLGDFFKLIAENKQEIADKKQLIAEQQRKEEQKLLEKKQKEEEVIKSHIDMGLSDLFEQLGARPKKERTKKKKVQIVNEEKQKKEEFDKLISSVISITEPGTTAETVKEEVIVKEAAPVGVTPEEHQEQVLTFLESFLTEKIDDIEEIKEEIKEEVHQETPSLVERSLGLLSEPSEVVKTDQEFATLDDLQAHYRDFLGKIQQQLSTLGGGGETRLEFLDDVDRDTAKVNGKFLKYDSSSDKWVGADASGGGSLSGTEGQFPRHDGSSFVGIASTAVADIIRDEIQGFYGYTTDFYTVGTANTTQDLEEDVFTLVQPQVAVGGTYPYLPGRMNRCNEGNPWVGSGATIGTGQTEFSLAGTAARSTCLVRIAYDFIPETDESDLDIRLHFTTNTSTQGTGLTNFNIDKQGLVCNVGAGITYSGENLLSFFVGETLEGDSKANSGKFCVQMNASDGGTLEVKALNVIVDT